MRLLSVALVVLLSTAASAQQVKDPVKIGPVPSWAQIAEPLPVPENARGLLFVRRQDYIVHLDKFGQSAFISTLVKVLHPSALQLGNISFAWNPAVGAPVVHTVKIHREGTVRDVLAATQFKVLQREDQLEASMLDGMLTATMTVPDLRVGDEIEVAFTLRNQDKTLGKDSFGTLLMVDKPAPGRFRIEMNWDEGQEPAIKPSPDMTTGVTRGTRSISYSADMPGPLAPPKDAPWRYSWQRTIEYSDFPSWQAVSGRVYPLFRKAAELTPQSEVKREADRIAAAYADPADRAAAALKLVQQQVRYVYVGFNGGNMTPASAEETWQRRYGDCKGKTALLLALLGSMGISAEPVLANNAGFDDGLDQRLPSPGFFDHVLVRAKVGDKTLWLDGTMPPVLLASAKPVLPYRWVLPLSEVGSPLEQLAWKPLERPEALMLFEIDARAGFDQPAKIRSTSITRGISAIGAYNQISSLTDEDLLREFKKEMEGGDIWTTVDQVTWHFDTKSQASILEIVGTGPLEWEKDRKSSRQLVLPGGGFSPPSRHQRGDGKGDEVPFYNPPVFHCSVTTVLLPVPTQQKEWSFNTSFNQTYFGDSYRRSFEIRDGSIRMIRARRSMQVEITPQAAMADNQRLPKFDNTKALIFHDPGSTTVADRSEDVPGAYENDWLADDSACLAPKSRPTKP